MSANITTLATRIATNLFVAMLDEAAGPHNNYTSTAFFGRWFHSPLPNNDYSHLVHESAAAPTPAPATRPHKTAVVEKQGLPPPPPAEPDDGRKRIKRVEITKSATVETLHSATISVVRNSNKLTATPITAAPSMAVTTTAYDGYSEIGVDTITKVYGEQHRDAINTLRSHTESRFATTGNSVVAKMTQTLLVIALEPIDPMIELVLNQSFRDDIILENLLDMISTETCGSQSRTPEDLEDELEHDAERLREFRRLFNHMSITLFSRFPELAIDLDELSTLNLLRSASSLWVCAKWLFATRRSMPQKIVAADMHAPFKAAFSAVFENRAPLLHALVISCIEAADPNKSSQVRDLFACSLLAAHRQVLFLSSHKPDNQCLQRGRSALMAVYKSIVAYRNSRIGMLTD